MRDLDRRQKLIRRLDEIGAALSKRADALALIGLGSAGEELERLDEHSDLDFFIIVRPGAKAGMLADLDWLAQVCPIDYAFLNTVDGYKLLFADNIFCEMAVFEPDELAAIPFAPGRVVWKAPGVSDDIRLPRTAAAPRHPASTEWALGEALTCLYVGLERYQRGEKLSAQRFIQHYAVDRLVEMAPGLEAELPGFPDPFNAERRFEVRFPGIASRLGDFIQGYDGSLQSARAMLDYLDARFAVNPAIKARIRRLSAPAGERAVYFITHPDVVIDPNVAVPQWPLSARGLERMHSLLRLPWVRDLAAVYCSDEQKAIDGAAVIASHLGLPYTRLAGLGEVDRSSTGYLPPEEHSQGARLLFDHPQESWRGWETAAAAQKRVVAAIEALLAADTSGGDIAIVSHGGAGTLTMCHVLGQPIDRRRGQPGNSGGCYFTFTVPSLTLLHDWEYIDR